MLCILSYSLNRLYYFIVNFYTIIVLLYTLPFVLISLLKPLTIQSFVYILLSLLLYFLYKYLLLPFIISHLLHFASSFYYLTIYDFYYYVHPTHILLKLPIHYTVHTTISLTLFLWFNFVFVCHYYPQVFTCPLTTLYVTLFQLHYYILVTHHVLPK